MAWLNYNNSHSQFSKHLDLVITSHPLNVLDLQIEESFFVTCDHYTVELKINFMFATSSKEHLTTTFTKLTSIKLIIFSQSGKDIFKSTNDVDAM